MSVKIKSVSIKNFRSLAHIESVELGEILSNPATCRSLRSLVKWCSQKIGDVNSERFQLLDGEVCHGTGKQIPTAV